MTTIEEIIPDLKAIQYGEFNGWFQDRKTGLRLRLIEHRSEVSFKDDHWSMAYPFEFEKDWGIVKDEDIPEAAFRYLVIAETHLEEYKAAFNKQMEHSLDQMSKMIEEPPSFPTLTSSPHSAV